MEARSGVRVRGARWSGGPILGIVAVALAFAVYLNALDGPFVYDDHFTVLYNPSIRTLDLGEIIRSDLFRPLTNLSFAIDYRMWGLSPSGFRLTNLILHAMNVLLLFRFAMVAIGDWRARYPGTAEEGSPPRFLAFVAAALFAVHPMMTEGVAYVSARADVLCATFFLLGARSMRAGLVRQRPGMVAVALGLAALAMTAKEIAAMFPFVLLAYDRLLLAGPEDARRQRLWRLHLPVLGLAVALAAVRVAVFLWVENPAPAAAGSRMWQYLVVQLEVVWRYVSLLVAPVSQSVFHAITPNPALAALGAVALVLGCGIAFRWRHQAPLAVFGTAWFLLLLAPSSSIVPLQYAMAEHRVYLPSAGFFLACAAGAGWAVGALRRASFGAHLAWLSALALVLTVLSGMTVARNRMWTDATTLWRDAAQKAPQWQTLLALGDALRAQAGCGPAIPVYEDVVRRAPDRLFPYAKLGACLDEVGRPGEARKVNARLLELDPDSTKLCGEIRALAPRLGRFEDCLEYFRTRARREAEPPSPGHG